MINRPLTLPVAPPTPPFDRRVALAAAVLVVATIAAYRGIFRAPFVFDDQASILDNASIRDLGQLGAVLDPPHNAGETVGGRPVLNLTFALNYAVSGPAVWSYHAVNFALHVASGLLLLGLLRRTLARSEWVAKIGNAATPLALAVTAVWLLHPLQIEAVTYSAQRAESLASFFLLLTLYAFVRGADSPTPRRWLGLSVVAGWLAAGTKEIAVVAPLLVLLCDRTMRSGSFGAALHNRGVYYAALASSWLLLAFLVLRHGGDRGGTAGLAAGVSPWTYALTQCHALTHYGRLAFWPEPLVFDYGIALVKTPGEVVARGLFVILLLGGTTLAIVRRSPLGMLGAFFFCILAPSSSFVPIASQPIAEHRMYLPLAAVLALSVFGAHAAIGRRAVAAGLTAAGLFAVFTWQRNQVYRSALSLWTDTVAHAPGNARAHNNLANALAAAGRTDEALAAYATALHLSPDYTDAQANYARALAQTGRPAEAIPHYEAVLRARPASVDTHFNLGNALLRTGDFTSARRHYEEVLRLQPERVDAHVNLAATLLRLDREPDAIAHYEAALRLAPDDVGAHIDLANVLVRGPRRADAIRHYEQALRLRPELTAVREQLDHLRAAPGAPRP